jgi:putative two-component system response regulator
MKTHTTIGAQILSNPKSAILEVARVIALSHHEQWDGKGYPQGLRGESIPLVGRIVRLADVFDALVSSRPYKKAYPLETALELIRRGREVQFDPALVDLLLEKVDDIMAIRAQVGDTESLPEGDCDWSERDSASRNVL